LSEKKERAKKMGMVVTRWVATRQRNEALDLIVMGLVAIETCRRNLDTMEPQIVVTGDEERKPVAEFGARRAGLPGDAGLQTYGTSSGGMAAFPKGPKQGGLFGAVNKPIT
jgi:hypothetical protein